MQSLIQADSNNCSTPFLNEKWVFASSCLFLLLISALISSFAPIAFSVATVFLFAGPHNWIELRYFLSRLPSRFGPLRGFFLTSITGVLVLGAAYASLVYSAREHFLDYDPAIVLFRFWIVAFHIWLAVLVSVRGSGLKPARLAILAAIATSALAGICAPLYFGLALTYLHPLVGVWILDRELKRSRPQWIVPYRMVVAFSSVVLAVMIAQLFGTASLAADTNLSLQITRHAGSFLLPDLSSHLLVSVHTFLEMLHYGVWLLAIPIATQLFAKRKFDVLKMPFTRNSSRLQKLISMVFIGSSAAVVALWFSFLNDYSATRDLYFTIAVFHILAELPFLMWLL